MITVNWFDVDKTIIGYQFEGRWSWDELYHAINLVNEMLSETSLRVDIVIDVSKSKGLPSGALTHLRNATLKAADNWGGGVFVGASSFIQSILSIFFRIYPRLGERYALAGSIEEAMNIIYGWRAGVAVEETPADP